MWLEFWTLEDGNRQMLDEEYFDLEKLEEALDELNDCKESLELKMKNLEKEKEHQRKALEQCKIVRVKCPWCDRRLQLICPVCGGCGYVDAEIT